MEDKYMFIIGDQEVKATYDDWEKLFTELESIFGIRAVEDNMIIPEYIAEIVKN